MKTPAIVTILLLLVSATGSVCERNFSSESDQPEIYVTGMVYNVVDGDTFNVTDFGRVGLADVDSLEMGTPEGEAAKLYAQLHLEGKTVRLDVDGSEGTDPYGRWICVVRLESPSGEVGENFNRMLVDDGHAVVTDYKDNKFDPLDWWPAFRQVDVSGWSLSTTSGDGVTLTIPEGTVIEPGESHPVTRECQWLDNSDESIVLKTDSNLEVGRTMPLNDDDNDGQIWFLTDEDDPKWRYGWP